MPLFENFFLIRNLIHPPAALAEKVPMQYPDMNYNSCLRMEANENPRKKWERSNALQLMPLYRSKQYAVDLITYYYDVLTHTSLQKQTIHYWPEVIILWGTTHASIRKQTFIT